MRTVALLICSNIFMTIAWYGHLKFDKAPLLLAILVSWLIALPEYALQVPANRWGYQGEFTAPQLKILQEVITIGVFIGFNYLWLRNRMLWTDWAAFALILLAVVVMMAPRMAAARGGNSSPPTATLPTPSPGTPAPSGSA